MHPINSVLYCVRVPFTLYCCLLLCERVVLLSTRFRFGCARVCVCSHRPNRTVVADCVA